MSDTQLNIAQYGRAMETIKWRIEATRVAIGAAKKGIRIFEVPILAEICVLQLRHCCELLAIGCIAIHRDIPQTKRLHKMWNAYEIMALFGKVKPQFFPRPIKSERVGENRWVQHPVTGALTKNELIKQYNFFGGILHTGTFEEFTNPTRREYDFSVIEGFHEKLIRLLDDHVYTLYDGKTMVRVLMHDEKSGGVSWNVLTTMR